ncbi:MAG TPA: hypothetical protein VF650_17375 [Allosphingosinicella sp.]|jgi:hypothetical protein
MRFLDELLEGGAGYALKQVDGGVSLQPADDSGGALEAFQGVVERVRRHEGEGYSIYLAHKLSDRPGRRIDRLVLAIDDKRSSR